MQFRLLITTAADSKFISEVAFACAFEQQFKIANRRANGQPLRDDDQACHRETICDSIIGEAGHRRNIMRNHDAARDSRYL
jgi:hypothetical protein